MMGLLLISFDTLSISIMQPLEVRVLKSLEPISIEGGDLIIGPLPYLGDSFATILVLKRGSRTLLLSDNVEYVVSLPDIDTSFAYGRCKEFYLHDNTLAIIAAMNVSGEFIPFKLVDEYGYYIFNGSPPLNMLSFGKKRYRICIDTEDRDNVGDVDIFVFEIKFF